VESDEVLALLVEVAEECITPRFRSLAPGEVSRKQRYAPVTVADREAEVRITEVLQGAHPDAVVLGEEAVAADPEVRARFRHAEHAFTVDPVDGTRQFVKGSPDHATMVAELRGGVAVRSWIWQPQHRRAYVAERGAGAWCDGRRLRREPVAAAPVLARRPWPGRAVGVTRQLRISGTCCGLDYPRIAEGEADHALAWRPEPWDHAPGSLLLTESGGVVGRLDGTPYRPQASPAGILVAAADRATYDAVRGVLAAGPWHRRHRSGR
jgi:fructose-1,6-bisphosphatase/inositol monophosphatase family enzyme